MGGKKSTTEIIVMGKGYWMIRTIKSGKVVEKSQFFVGERKPRKDRRKGSSSDRKKDSNMTLSGRILAREINCNFAAGDLFITLTLSDEIHEQIFRASELYKQADKLFKLFYRRVSRMLCSKGIKIKCIWIAADKDEKNGKPVRLHYHMLLGQDGIDVTWKDGVCCAAISGKDISDIWGNGFVNVEILKEQDDYTPVALYMIRQAVNIPGVQKWHSSRGMEKPVIESEAIIDKPHELRAPGGADVKEVSHYDVDSGSHYMRYIRRPKGKRPALPDWGENEQDLAECFEGGART